MPVDDRDLDNLREGITGLAHASPLIAAGDALGSAGQKVLDAKDYSLSKARSLGEDLANHVRSYFAPAVSASRDIELPRDPKTARSPSKLIARSRSMRGGTR